MQCEIAASIMNNAQKLRIHTMANDNKKFTFFFTLASPFSNFHPAKIQYKNYTFCSNEQFMMFGKAKTFKDEATASKILEINNDPLIQDFLNGVVSSKDIVNNGELSARWNKLMMSVKSLGRGVKNYDDAVWAEKREKIVFVGAREKFSQNEDMRTDLMATTGTKMVEASKFDKIWGIGLSEYDAKKVPSKNWPGLNLLGKVLDEVRDALSLKAEINRPSPRFKG